MKRLLFSFSLMAACLSLSAQDVATAPAQEGQDVAPANTEVPTAHPHFGYISYKQVFEQMLEYAEAQKAFADLKAKYDAEAKRSEDEFQRKFAEFLQGQKDFPASIMQKRQMELQDLMDRSVNFRQESQRLLRKAEAELQAPVAAKLNEVIKAVATERDLLFVLNTDDNAVPFINTMVGVNLTEPVLQKLGLASAVGSNQAEEPNK